MSSKDVSSKDKIEKTFSILENYPDYEVNIGMEVHVQLTTKSKIFCSCSNEITKEPNTNICQICSGHPGTLPVLNAEVVKNAVLAGLATNCNIEPVCYFARKHYFYPDLPKGYQTTQSDKPICYEGYLPIKLEDGSIKNIRINRIHMEEDAGKNIHSNFSQESFVDLNRAGTPLLEIVSYPDISSAYETRAYLKSLHSIVKYLNICTGNMEDGAFRADTNISVRKKGAKELGTKCELKNINSFKFISDAIEYEIERQIDLIENGGKVQQETRLWDTKNKKTISMRSKEGSADYRYFEEPDLPLIEVSQEYIKQIRSTLPELPMAKIERLIKENGLSQYEAEIIAEDLDLASYFENSYKIYSSKNIINWVLRDILGLLKDQRISLNECKITPERLAKLVELLDTGKINNRGAKEVFEEIALSGKEPSIVIKEKGLEQIGSVEDIEKIVKEIIDSNPDNVALYKSGKDRVFGFFVGECMKKLQGKGDPKIIQDLLKKYLQN
ncbi:MAG: Aspartyl/glutamyl-tRNA(Asn/Gln) amidotransferase subunit B [candidate division TM6 bacterium GW2011_GWF2_30_66]|jgi:aspartyl-tRNA(Asn)/glutamyl-tRNA(Gln) amidotransferase subunit B|nr:MAG: Aspartyl/glutamyl-tRNA(Asn/Gln) amidotransferase subunit B [candidate division TM6 bacterium GW2011_GWF2_30_66]